MAVLTELSDDWGKPVPTMFTLHVAPEPGGAVTGTVLQLAGQRPEPTQRGCSGGQVDTLTSNGDQQFGETEALILYEGLGGDCGTSDDRISPFLPLPTMVMWKNDNGISYSLSSKQMALITNLKEGDVSLA